MSFINMTVLSHGKTIRDEFLFPDAEYEVRLEKINGFIKKKGLDGILLYSDSLTRGNVSYLSGFSNFLAWSVSMVILPKDGKPTLLATIAPRDVEFTSKLLPGFVDVVSAGLSLVSNEHISVKAIEYMQEKGLISSGKWGCVNFGRLPHMAVTPWRDVFPDGLMDCTGEYTAIRAIKSEAEIYVISQASSMAKRSVYEYLRQARPGANEMLLSSKIDREQRISGANSVSILTDAGKLTDTALHVPRDRNFEIGDTVCVFADIGLQGYHGSFGATKVIGAIGTEQESLFTAASELMYEKMINMSNTKKSIIGQQDSEYRNYTYYTIVNGIGCDTVEYPDQYGCEVEFVPGMAISLSLRVKERSIGPVFMSENFLVTENNLIAMSGPGK